MSVLLLDYGLYIQHMGKLCPTHQLKFVTFTANYVTGHTLPILTPVASFYINGCRVQ